ncbi:MAG TPA: aminotransferase class III-fold pyridoxal phosphate-dependent enzyme, partial [Burkholderiales bacterium]|nr:aminotransferase class III-fold pyridoxal phosphate-dependent enzyme [Burkholderiales bacterium]
IFRDDDVINRNRELAGHMARATAPMADHPHVAEVRQTGMILAIEMVRGGETRAPYPWQERRGLSVYRYALEHGALLRPLGDVIYFMPPYVITTEEIDLLARVAREGINHATV